MSLTKFVMQPTLQLHLLCGFKKYIHIFILYNIVNMSDIVGCITNFVRLIITRESPCIYLQFYDIRFPSAS
jgi:hypothetical protein